MLFFGSDAQSFNVILLISNCFVHLEIQSNALARNLGIYSLLHLVFLLLRILLITLLGLSHTPALYYKHFVPLASLQTASSAPSDYGTFATAAGSIGGAPPTAHVLSTKAQIREPPKPAGLLQMLQRIKILFPYLWPGRSVALQAVAFLCFACLLVGRGVNLLVPMTLGKAVEDLTVGALPWAHLGMYVVLRFLQGSGGIVSGTYSLGCVISCYNFLRLV